MTALQVIGQLRTVCDVEKARLSSSSSTVAVRVPRETVALDPLILQPLVREAIESLIDDDELAATRLAEESERTILANITASMGGGA